MLSQEQLAHVTSYSGLVAGAGPSLGPLGQVGACSREWGPYEKLPSRTLGAINIMMLNIPRTLYECAHMHASFVYRQGSQSKASISCAFGCEILSCGKA